MVFVSPLLFVARSDRTCNDCSTLRALFIFYVLVCEMGKKAKLRHERIQLDKKVKLGEYVTMHMWRTSYSW